jgi:capsular exopolysaccharide synthesis family protein
MHPAMSQNPNGSRNVQPQTHASVPAPGYEDVSAYSAYPGSSPPYTGEHRRYLIFLRKKWWIVVLTLLFFGGLGAAYIAWWPDSYASTAHLWAAGRTGLQLREGTTYADDNLNFAGTQIELLQSDLILGRAFNRVQQTLHISFPTNSEGKPILPSLKASQLPKSAVLELKAKGTTADCVVAFLNAIMDEFIAYKKEVRAATSGDTYTSVSEQTVRQEAELKAAQDKLTTYQRDNNVAVLEEQAKAASTYLTQLLAELSQLKVECQLLEAMSPQNQFALTSLTNALASAGDPRRLTDLGLPSTAPSPDSLSAQQELEKIKIVRARLSKYLRPEHPKIIKLDEEISRGEKFVEFFGQQSRDQLANAKQTARLKIDRVQETIKEWEAKVNNASVRIAEYERMKLEVERLQGLNDRLLSLLQTVDVSRNLDQENITILDRASEPKSAKRSPIVAGFLLFLGLTLGLSLVLLVERSDDRVLSVDELGGRFDEWILGQVPTVKTSRKKRTPALVQPGDSRHIFAESHRNIRSALFFANYNDEKPRMLLVTSAIPNEGKSTVAANLACTIALAGSRVLLVDADLRRGMLHRLFKAPQEPGFSELLTNGDNLAQLIIPTAIPNLWLLPRGRTVNNTAELFLSQKCDSLLARMRSEYDCVILDSIPIFAADDTTSLAPKMDGVLFVVRGNYTRTRTARRALEQLYERQTKVLGLVFNRADASSRSYDYYKYVEYYDARRRRSEFAAGTKRQPLDCRVTETPNRKQ